MVHLLRPYGGNFWVGLCLVLLFAMIGFLLGFLSLYLMQQVIAERCGSAAGWLFTMAVTMASGFAIYLGRFLRWNSWDVVVHPLDLSYAIGHLAKHPFEDKTTMFFPPLFATFLFLGYLMLYALTHLRQPQTPEVGVRHLPQV
jgi:uncharacterized membrane protein